MNHQPVDGARLELPPGSSSATPCMYLGGFRAYGVEWAASDTALSTRYRFDSVHQEQLLCSFCRPV